MSQSLPTLNPSAKELAKSVCHTCGRTSPQEHRHCGRCGSTLHIRKHDSIQRCLAFCVASIIAYIPANIWPIMVVNQLGNTEPSTIIGGVIQFWNSKVYSVALIIFTASVLIPGLKLMSLFILCAVAKGWVKIDPRTSSKIYYLTELVGKWSMIDVFVVAILVGLIQLGNMMSITAGAAAVSFTLMVVLTMIGAHCFDPRVIWDRYRTLEED